MAVMGLGICYYRMGEKDKAEKLFKNLKERSAHEYIPPSCFSVIHLAKGELDLAFQWIDKAYEIHDSYLVYMANLLKKYIGSDPRFKALLKKMNLPID